VLFFTILNAIDNTSNSCNHRKQIGEVLQEILNPKNGKIQLFDHNGLIAIADPRNEWVWQNPMLQTLHTDPSLNYTYATQNDQLWITETPQQDLKQWLWNLLWASKVGHFVWRRCNLSLDLYVMFVASDFAKPIRYEGLQLQLNHCDQTTEFCHF
jgi:hypothetical protein